MSINHVAIHYIRTRFLNNYNFEGISTKNIWILIDATNPNLNNKGGEYKFHSILNDAPAYHNAKNDFLAFDGENEWYIMSEDRFVISSADDIFGGWFKINSRGTLK